MPSGINARSCHRQESGCPELTPVKKRWGVRSKILVLRPRVLHGKPRKGMQEECKEATHISASPAVFGLGVSKCIKIKMHKYAVQILIQSFAVSIKQNSLIFQTTLLTFYRFLADNMEDITAALAEFPSESSLSRNYFFIHFLFPVRRSSGEATGQSKGFSRRRASGKGFHLSCSLHTWTFPFCQQSGHLVRPVIFKLFVIVWAGLVSLQNVILQICHKQKQTFE